MGLGGGERDETGERKESLKDTRKEKRREKEVSEKPMAKFK